jgi:hypothetical protein
MIHTIHIDDKTKVGKNLLGIVKTISEQNKKVVFIEDDKDSVPFEMFAHKLKTTVKKRLTKKE